MDFPASGASDHQLAGGEASKLGHQSPHIIPIISQQRLFVMLTADMVKNNEEK
jgi:hypothetical protein